MSKKRRGLFQFLLGASVGAGVGMLLTKNNGKENREQLKKKIDELLVKAKSIDSKELKENIQAKVDEIIVGVSELDKEKVLKIAKKKAEDIKQKSEELVEYVIDKGTPVLEKSAAVVREKAVAVTKEVLKKTWTRRKIILLVCYEVILWKEKL